MTVAKGRLWMIFPWALLGAALTGWGFMARLAVKDPGFSLEQDYYKKATTWDREQAQRAENARLGWTLAGAQSSSGVTLTLYDGSGAPISGAAGELQGFAVARASDLRDAALREVSPGKYEAPVRFSRAGLWELRVTVRKGTDTFTHTLRLDAAPEGKS